MSGLKFGTRWRDSNWTIVLTMLCRTGEKDADTGVFGAGIGGIQMMRRFTGVRLSRLTRQPAATVGWWQQGKAHRISFGALSSPALRIHTLAPVSFPSSLATSLL
jgi:hypothetical protein